MIRPKKLNAITLTVRDVERSLAWYKEKFGFEKLFDDTPNSKSVVVGINGVELLLRPVDNPDDTTNVDTEKQICIPMIAFEVNEADLNRVEDEFSEDRKIVRLDDHPKYRSRIIEDPDGHAIELYVDN